jgi:hypothetical protein
LWTATLVATAPIGVTSIWPIFCGREGFLNGKHIDGWSLRVSDE